MKKKAVSLIVGILVGVFIVLVYDSVTHKPVTTNPKPVAQETPLPTPVIIQSVNYIVDLVNNERVTRGLQPVIEIENLDTGATKRAMDMVKKGQWSHDGYAEAMYKSLIDPAHSLIGECLAQYYDNGYDVFDAWMNSPTHKAVIIRDRYKYIGVGYFQSHWVLWMSNVP